MRRPLLIVLASALALAAVGAVGGYSAVNAATRSDPVNLVEPWAFGDAVPSIRSPDVDEGGDRESEEEGEAESPEEDSRTGPPPSTPGEVTPNADGTLPDNYREDIPEFTPEPAPSPERGGGGRGGGEELSPEELPSDELPGPEEGIPPGEFSP